MNAPILASPAPARLAFAALLGGLVATVAFDLFGQVLSPALGFPKLAPVGLARQSLGVLLGPGASQYAGVAHWLTGIVAYSLAYVLAAQPIANKIAPRLHWLVVASVYGVVLWVFALYVMAHLVAGNRPFLGFGQLTWVALVGHVLFGVVLGAVVAMVARR